MDQSELESQLGKLSLNYSRLEHQIDASIGVLIYNDHGLEKTDSEEVEVVKNPDQRVGQIVTANMNFNMKIDVLVSLFLYRQPKSLELKELIKRIRSAQSLRNKYIHSVWAMKQPDGSYPRFKHKIGEKGYAFDQEVVTIEQLRKENTEIDKLSWDILNFLMGKQSA